MVSAAHITRSYLICSTPRSGSNWLCEVLKTLGIAGRPEEYFWNLPFWYERCGVSDFATFFARLVQEGTTPNGVFGSKLMWDQCRHLVAQLASLFRLDAMSDAEVLAHAFPDVRYVWLTRRDKVRQGVSFHRALLTERWRSTEGGACVMSDADFDIEAIGRLIELSEDEDAEWQAFFAAHHITPLEVVYEDVVASLEIQVQRILQHVGVVGPEPLVLSTDWRHQRQADAVNELWVERYRSARGVTVPSPNC